MDRVSLTIVLLGLLAALFGLLGLIVVLTG
jgi:hypothetical protein